MGGHDRRTMTPDTVRELVRLYADEGVSMNKLAHRFNISQPQVSAILTGRSWANVTGGVNHSRHGQERPAWIYRDRLSAEVDEMVTRTAKELDISESEVRRHLRRIFHPKPEDRK